MRNCFRYFKDMGDNGLVINGCRFRSFTERKGCNAMTRGRRKAPIGPDTLNRYGRAIELAYRWMDANDVRQKRLAERMGEQEADLSNFLNEQIVDGDWRDKMGGGQPVHCYWSESKLVRLIEEIERICPRLADITITKQPKNAANTREGRHLQRHRSTLLQIQDHREFPSPTGLSAMGDLVFSNLCYIGAAKSGMDALKTYAGIETRGTLLTIATQLGALNSQGGLAATSASRPLLEEALGWVTELCARQSQSLRTTRAGKAEYPIEPSRPLRAIAWVSWVYYSIVRIWKARDLRRSWTSRAKHICATKGIGRTSSSSWNVALSTIDVEPWNAAAAACERAQYLGGRARGNLVYEILSMRAYPMVKKYWGPVALEELTSQKAS